MNVLISLFADRLHIVRMGPIMLNQRIKDIMCMRAKQGFADPTPTLVDLERTHILYVNAHFKPFNLAGLANWYTADGNSIRKNVC